MAASEHLHRRRAMMTLHTAYAAVRKLQQQHDTTPAEQGESLATSGRLPVVASSGTQLCIPCLLPYPLQGL